MPELKVCSPLIQTILIKKIILIFPQGRNLEEIDQLFDANLPAWKFSKYETEGLTHELTMLENGEDSKKVDVEADVEIGHVESRR